MRNAGAHSFRKQDNKLYKSRTNHKQILPGFCRCAADYDSVGRLGVRVYTGEKGWQ